MTQALTPAIELDLDGIPAELRERPQWVLWKLEERDRKLTKIPYQVDGRKAEADDPSTWNTFEAVVGRFNRGGYSGVGYEFSVDDPFVGIDLDDCRDPLTGKWTDWAEDIIATVHSYTEVSPSGTGYKIFCRGTLAHLLPPPDEDGKIKTGRKKAYKGGAVEVFYCGKYFTLTGSWVVVTPDECKDAQPAIDELWAKVFAPPVEPQKEVDAQNAHQPTAGNRSDHEIIEKARTFRNGDKFSQLWAGQYDGDHSAADQALCNLLAFVVGPDPARIDSLFRQSALVREKWTSRQDYRRATIDKALERREFYQWERNGHRANGHARNGSVSGAHKAHPKTTKRITNAGQREGDDGKSVSFPLPMQTILANFRESTGDWPRRVGDALFVDHEHEVQWIRGAPALFGWASSLAGTVDWRKGTGYVTKEEFFAEVQRTAEAYTAVETMPHVPTIEGHYYCHAEIGRGDGESLRKLLDRFNPATDVDRDLLQAMFVTPCWGGRGGCRPAFVLTSDAGRGSGKTKAAAMLGLLYGGLVELSANEDAGIIRQRLLSPDALGKRVVLLDNVKTLRFSWAELESMITAPMISGKRMYVGEAARPNTITWVITLNGVALASDMAQRSIIIKLDKPTHAAGWEEETVSLIVDNRRALIADVVAFFEGQASKLGKFSRWGSWERDVLARLPEPGEAQKVIAERQGAADVEGEEADIVEEFFAQQLANLSYTVDSDRVLIPSPVAAGWFNKAMNIGQSVSAASRLMKQMHDEGKLPRIIENKCRTYGRGFLWQGVDVLAETQIRTDLQDRIQTNERRR